MSTTTAITVPAGWYADPVQAAAGAAVTQCRWWDGAQWTAHVTTISTPVSPVVGSTRITTSGERSTPPRFGRRRRIGRSTGSVTR